MTSAYAIRHGIFVPRYACEARPGGLIPPSPPAEYRAKLRRAIVKALRALASYSGLIECGRYSGRVDDLVHAFGTDMPFGMTSGLHALTGLDTPASGTSTLQDPAYYVNLVAYYKLEEASGNRADATERGNTLTDVNNNVTNGAGPTNLGNGAKFPGTNGTLSKADSADVQLMAGAFTIQAWSYLTSLASGNAAIVTKYDNNSSHGGWDIYYNQFSGKVQFKVSSTNFNHDGGYSGAYSTGQWEHYVGVCDGLGTSVYRNAVAGTTGYPIGTALLESAVAFRLGARANGDMFITANSLISDVAVWKGRQLSGTDVTGLYASGNGLPLY